MNMRPTRPRLCSRLRRKNAARNGTAVVELAVCSPLLVTIIFGSIQAASLLHLRSALETSAHHGSLLAIKTEASESDVISQIQNLLTARGVNGATVTLSGDNEPFADVQRGELFEVVVTAPVSQNLAAPKIFFVNSHVEARVKATKQ